MLVPDEQPLPCWSSLVPKARKVKVKKAGLFLVKEFISVLVHKKKEDLLGPSNQNNLNSFPLFKKKKQSMYAVEDQVTNSVGRVTQIIGPVVDITFSRGKMPNIYNAILIKGTNLAGQDVSVTCEVQQLLGDHCVRAVAMNATDGLMRGMQALDTGYALSVPVGATTLGRIFNVVGDPVDGLEETNHQESLPIHRSAPAFVDLDTKLAIFETGIKVVDLLAPYRRGGKIGLFGGAGVGKTVLIMELIV